MAIRYPGYHDLGAAVCEALGVNATEVERIIIDIDSRDAVPIHAYVQMIVTDRILNVDWAAGLKGAEITILNKE